MSRRGPLIVGVIAAALAALVVLILVLPKVSEIGQRREELQEAEDRESALRAQLAQLEEAREQARAVRRRLAELKGQVPPTTDLPGLIRLLQGSADQAAVDFLSVSPGAPTAVAGQFSFIPTQITVTGGFFSVDDFLFRLETLPRAVKVIAVSVTSGPEGLPQLQISMNTEVYTTDTSAGPGSEPGPSETEATPEASPSPGG
jgi:Tfp pilus assembly protein PilO